MHALRATQSSPGCFLLVWQLVRWYRLPVILGHFKTAIIKAHAHSERFNARERLFRALETPGVAYNKGYLYQLPSARTPILPADRYKQCMCRWPSVVARVTDICIYALFFCMYFWCLALLHIASCYELQWNIKQRSGRDKEICCTQRWLLQCTSCKLMLWWLRSKQNPRHCLFASLIVCQAATFAYSPLSLNVIAVIASDVWGKWCAYIEVCTAGKCSEYIYIMSNYLRRAPKKYAHVSRDKLAVTQAAPLTFSSLYTCLDRTQGHR